MKRRDIWLYERYTGRRRYNGCRRECYIVSALKEGIAVTPLCPMVIVACVVVTGRLSVELVKSITACVLLLLVAMVDD